MRESNICLAADSFKYFRAKINTFICAISKYFQHMLLLNVCYLHPSREPEGAMTAMAKITTLYEYYVNGTECAV